MEQELLQQIADSDKALIYSELLSLQTTVGLLLKDAGQGKYYYFPSELKRINELVSDIETKVAIINKKAKSRKR